MGWCILDATSRTTKTIVLTDHFANQVEWAKFEDMERDADGKYISEGYGSKIIIMPSHMVEKGKPILFMNPEDFEQYKKQHGNKK